MGHVLVELEKLDNTTELTMASLGKAFSRCGIEARFLLLDQIGLEELAWCDSYLAVRPNTPMSVRLAQSIVNSGRFYSVMFDDDLLNHKGALKWRANCTRKCLSLAALVIGVNPALTREYASFTKSNRGAVINTPVGEDEYIPTHSVGETVRFVYAAGRDHARIFEKQLKPAVNSFLEEYSDKVHFTFIGVEPDLTGLSHKECFSFIPLMPLHKYNEYMKENEFDVGLAPLEDNQFSSRKYFNKFIEYAKVGITGLYSNCLPFTLIVEERTNGILVNNNEEDWKQALVLAVKEKSLIEKCAIKAQEKLRENFSIDQMANAIKNSIPEFEEYNCSGGVKWQKPVVRSFCFKFLDKTKKFVYQIKHMGIKSTAKLIRNYINDHK